MVIKNISGFSIVEVLVSLGLISFAALANLALTDLVNSQKLYERKQSNLTALYGLMSRELGASDTCTSILKGKSINQELLPISLERGNLNLEQGQTLRRFGVVPQSVRVSSVEQITPFGVPLPRMLVQISARFDFDRSVPGGVARATMPVASVYLYLASDNTIIERCEGVLGEDIAGSCGQLGCVYSSQDRICQCPIRSFQCPPGQLLMEIRLGMPVCVAIGNSQTCPAGTLTTSISPGNLTCRQAP